MHSERAAHDIRLRRNATFGVYSWDAPSGSSMNALDRSTLDSGQPSVFAKTAAGVGSPQPQPRGPNHLGPHSLIRRCNSLFV